MSAIRAGVPFTIPLNNLTPPTHVASTGVQNIATSMVNSAQTFMNALMNAGWFQPPSINPVFPTIETAPHISTAEMPTLKNISWVTPSGPAAFTQTVPDISKYLPAPFSGKPPTLSIGAMPQADYGVAPAAPSVDLNFTFPTLNLSIPAAPSLLAISVSKFDGVTLPTLSADVPVLSVVAPNILAYKEGAIYVSTLLTSLEADLTSALTTGKGLIVGGAVENAIWDRAREREYRQQADALAELERMEGLGYAFPPGVYLDARLKIQTETDYTIAGASREIMVKQAENLLENIKQARTVAVELEGKQIEYANQVAQRAFESGKFVAEASIQVYNAQVEAYKAQLDGYRTRAAIFETLMKGAQLKVDIYKAELDAEKTKVEMDTALVQQYEAQIRAQALFVDIYKAELGSIETQANLQKIIVDVYGEEIKGFVGRVNAYTSEVEAYRAQLQSQEVLTSIFKTEVEAYSATVQAGVGMSNAVIEGYKAQISGYTARLDAYRTEISAMSEQVKAGSLYNSAVADVYRSEMQALSSYNSVLTEQWRASADIAEKEAEVAIKAAEAAATMYVQSRQVAVEALKGGGQVAAQIGAAALNAIHWSENNSFSASLSQSYSASVGNSYSASQSDSASV